MLPFSLCYTFLDAQNAMKFFSSCRQVVGQFGVFSVCSLGSQNKVCYFLTLMWYSPQVHGRASSETSSSSASQVLLTEFIWWLVNRHVKKICGPAFPLCNSRDLSTKLCTLAIYISVSLSLQFLAFLLEMETCKDIFKMVKFLVETKKENALQLLNVGARCSCNTRSLVSPSLCLHIW